MAEQNPFTLSRKKRGREALQQGRLDEAVTLLKEVCGLDRRDADAWFMLGLAQVKQNDLAGAETSLHQAVSVRPTSAEYWQTFGQIFELRGRQEQAVTAYRQAWQHKPELTQPREALLRIARAMQEGGAVEKAEAICADVVRRAPQDVEALLQLGGIALALDKLDDAKAQFDAVLQQQPEHAQAKAGLSEVTRRRG